jgi:hypothetical protein
MDFPAQVGLAETIGFFVGFVVMFPVFWCCVMAFISFFGGWHALASSFRAEEKIFRIPELNQGKRFRCASLTMGRKYFPINYGNCLTIQISNEGFRNKMWLLLRFLHPLLFIPWRNVERCKREKVLLFFSRTAVYLNNRQHPLRFQGAAGKEIFDVYSQQVASKGNAIHVMG